MKHWIARIFRARALTFWRKPALAADPPLDADQPAAPPQGESPPAATAAATTTPSVAAEAQPSAKRALFPQWLSPKIGATIVTLAVLLAAGATAFLRQTAKVQHLEAELKQARAKSPAPPRAAEPAASDVRIALAHPPEPPKPSTEAVRTEPPPAPKPEPPPRRTAKAATQVAEDCVVTDRASVMDHLKNCIDRFNGGARPPEKSAHKP